MTEYRLNTKITESLEDVQANGSVIFVTSDVVGGAGYDRGYGIHQYDFEFTERPQINDIVIFPSVSGYESASATESKAGCFIGVVRELSVQNPNASFIVPLNGPINTGPTGRYMAIPDNIKAGSPAVIIGHGGVVLKSDDPENYNWPSFSF